MSRVKGDPRLEGFREPDYAIDVDFAAQIAAVPESGTIKGMFLSELVDEIEQYAPDQRGQIPLAQRRYLSFSDYSQRDYLRLLEHVVALVHPDLPTGEGVRRIAWNAFPRFVTSRIGRIVVGVFLDDLDRLVSAMATATRYCISPGTVKAVRMGERYWHYQIRDMRGATTPYFAGASEGVLKHYGLTPEVLIRDVGPGNFDLSIQWTGTRDSGHES